jgi:ParB family chromosome partitioning protein
MSARLLLNSERFTLSLSALSLSDSNVRKVSPGYIENLAASIAAEGVIQNLVVIATKKKKGSLVSHAVVAGKRRYLALMHLLREGAITLDYEVPVLLKERNNATVVSLVENFHRELMHPIDEFKAFNTLANEGLSITEISLRLGVSNASVRQRLALGGASPELLEECLTDRLSLEQLKVLCQLESHERQNELWFSTPDGWQRNPQHLRDLIRGEVIKVSNKLVTFVGLDSYQDSGGGVSFDLFTPDTESVITNPELLSSLAMTKLTTLAEGLGWAWCEVVLDVDHERVREFKRTSPAAREMTEEEATTMDLWVVRLTELEDLLESGDSDNVEALQAEYNELDSVMDAFHAQLLEWGDIKKIGGVYTFVSPNGHANFYQGLLRKQDVAALESEDDAVSGSVSVTTEKGMSGSLKEHLACVRASIIQAEIIKNPRIGVVLLCQNLVLTIFYRSFSSFNYLDISLTSQADALGKQGLEALPSSLTVAGMHDKWQARLPNEAELLDFLLSLDALELDELMAFCSSYALKLHFASIDANSRYAAVVNLLGTDVSCYWQATAENFFNRLNKPLIFDALNCAGVDTDGLTDKLKKSELAARAGDRIKQNPAWLPEILATRPII